MLVQVLLAVGVLLWSACFFDALEARDLGALGRAVGLFSLLLAFVGILWRLSGEVSVLGVPISGHMVGLALADAGAAAVAAFSLGRQFTVATEQRQATEASFRDGLRGCAARGGVAARPGRGAGAGGARRALRRARHGLAAADGGVAQPARLPVGLCHARPCLPAADRWPAPPRRRSHAGRADADGAGLPAGRVRHVLAGGPDGAAGRVARLGGPAAGLAAPRLRAHPPLRPPQRRGRTKVPSTSKISSWFSHCTSTMVRGGCGPWPQISSWIRLAKGR